MMVVRVAAVIPRKCAACDGRLFKVAASEDGEFVVSAVLCEKCDMVAVVTSDDKRA